MGFYGRGNGKLFRGLGVKAFKLVQLLRHVVPLLLRRRGRRRERGPLQLSTVADGKDAALGIFHAKVGVHQDASGSSLQFDPCVPQGLNELDGLQARGPDHHAKGQFAPITERRRSALVPVAECIVFDAFNGGAQADIYVLRPQAIEVSITKGFVERSEDRRPRFYEAHLDMLHQVRVPLLDILLQEVVELGDELAARGPRTNHHEGQQAVPLLCREGRVGGALEALAGMAACTW